MGKNQTRAILFTEFDHDEDEIHIHMRLCNMRVKVIWFLRVVFLFAFSSEFGCAESYFIDLSRQTDRRAKKRDLWDGMCNRNMRV